MTRCILLIFLSFNAYSYEFKSEDFPFIFKVHNPDAFQSQVFQEYKPYSTHSFYSVSGSFSSPNYLEQGTENSKCKKRSIHNYFCPERIFFYYRFEPAKTGSPYKFNYGGDFGKKKPVPVYKKDPILGTRQGVDFYKLKSRHIYKKDFLEKNNLRMNLVREIVCTARDWAGVDHTLYVESDKHGITMKIKFFDYVYTEDSYYKFPISKEKIKELDDDYEKEVDMPSRPKFVRNYCNDKDPKVLENWTFGKYLSTIRDSIRVNPDFVKKYLNPKLKQACLDYRKKKVGKKFSRDELYEIFKKPIQNGKNYYKAYDYIKVYVHEKKVVGVACPLHDTKDDLNELRTKVKKLRN